MLSHAEAALELLAAIAAAIWLGMVCWIMGHRLLHDARNRKVDLTIQALRDPDLAARPLDQRMAVVHRLLKRLPLHSLEVLMMTHLPAWALDACAVRIEHVRNPERFLATARSGPGRARKWDYIAALFVLARARHAQCHVLLASALATADPDIRNAAITLLGELGDQRAAQILVTGLEAGDSLRARIASQLDAFKTPVAEQLDPLTVSSDPDVRAWGALLLWRYASLPGIDAHLARLAADVDAGVRKAAVQSLAEAVTPVAASTARSMLHDPAAYVRAHAARTLARADAGNAAADIAPLLADPDWWVRQAVKESLSHLGLPAMPQVLPLLDSPDRFARNGAADVLQDIGAVTLLVERSHHPGAEGEEARALLEGIMRAGERQMIDADAPMHPSWQPSAADAADKAEASS